MWAGRIEAVIAPRNPDRVSLSVLITKGYRITIADGFDPGAMFT
jgi:hypothetical protein